MPADNDPLVNLDEIARLLETHEGLPEPMTRPPSPSRSGLRVTGAVATGALVVGSALGFGLGSSLTPSGAAASTPTGLGFVPDSGWTVLQSGRDAAPLRAAFAIASSVPLHPEDNARGIRTSSGLPYATLLGLPPHGIVIVATFTIPVDQTTPAYDFPERKLPLRLGDATPFGSNSTQIRPERPLGEYELRANVNRRDVYVHFYFGTPRPSPEMAAAAQRQLDGLLVDPARRTSAVERPALPRATTATATGTATTRVDRTLLCRPGFRNGARTILVSSMSATRRGDRFESLAHITVTTPGNPVPSRRDQFQPTLAGITAGWPPAPPLVSGGIGFENRLCKPVRAQVRLSSRGLRGGVAPAFFGEVTCAVPKTVLVRVKATFVEQATLELSKEKNFYSAVARLRRGQIAARTLTGKPLVYGDVLDSGRARVFTAGSCF